MLSRRAELPQLLLSPTPVGPGPSPSPICPLLESPVLLFKSPVLLLFKSPVLLQQREDLESGSPRFFACLGPRLSARTPRRA
uniref:Uncharacterized protein n=1 Tax=Arundo donax TaxID=35708 RepID=A0A0A9EMM4_ARUDO